MPARAQWTIFRRPENPSEPTPPPFTLPVGPRPLPKARRHLGPAGRSRGPLAWPSAPRPRRSGEVLNGRYELLSRLGQGGMGEVYAARFLASRRQVAVKLLDPLLASDPEIVARFRHEYLILTRVLHRHLVRAIDMAVSDEGQPYFTMELVRGPTLEQHLKSVGRLSPAQVIELGDQLCGAVSALHRAGVIHRDIKPTNVLLTAVASPSASTSLANANASAKTKTKTKTLDVRLIDLGIAWLSPLYYADTDPYMTPPAARVDTGHGVLLGTPGYTPPEAGRHRCGPAHDVFALGVLLYRALTGHMPFAAPYGAFDGEFARPFAALGLSNPPPAALEQVLLAALAPAPQRRLHDPEELARRLLGTATGGALPIQNHHQGVKTSCPGSPLACSPGASSPQLRASCSPAAQAPSATAASTRRTLRAAPPAATPPAALATPAAIAPAKAKRAKQNE